MNDHVVTIKVRLMKDLHIKTMAELAAAGQQPDILFWVGCAGSFDTRAQHIAGSFTNILNEAGIRFAILGEEESCTGDPAKRAGNEYLFQMTALTNIHVLNSYHVKKIVCICPHCFNTLKNEYPGLGGVYEVVHHTELIQKLIKEGRLTIKPNNDFEGKKVTYHDACYLGRGNDIYAAPREILTSLKLDLLEMKRCKASGLCCGAGGAQMFKEPEKGKKDINIERVEEALSLDPQIIASSCPFCATMLNDGIKHFEKENTVSVLDIVEIIDKSQSSVNHTAG